MRACRRAIHVDNSLGRLPQCNERTQSDGDNEQGSSCYGPKHRGEPAESQRRLTAAGRGSHGAGQVHQSITIDSSFGRNQAAKLSLESFQIGREIVGMRRIAV